MALTYHKKDDEREEKNTADPWRVFGMGYRREKAPNVPVAATSPEVSRTRPSRPISTAAPSPATIRDVAAAGGRQSLAGRLPAPGAGHRRRRDRTDARRTLGRTAAHGSWPPRAHRVCNACGLRCEEYVLQSRGVHYDDVELVRQSQQHGWPPPDGMRIGDVRQCPLALRTARGEALRLHARTGRRVAPAGSQPHPRGRRRRTCRRHPCRAPRGPLHRRNPRPRRRPAGGGFRGGTVDIFDPQGKPEGDTWPIAQFDDAWADSSRYAVVVSHPGAENAWRRRLGTPRRAIRSRR